MPVTVRAIRSSVDPGFAVRSRENPLGRAELGLGPIRIRCGRTTDDPEHLLVTAGYKHLNDTIFSFLPQ